MIGARRIEYDKVKTLTMEDRKVERILKRVPLDFDYPLNHVWYGYYSSFCHNGENTKGGCDDCKRFAILKGLKSTSSGCPDFEPYLGPPTGDGFQLWEITSEGSPISPVFKTLDELCGWCETNATVYAGQKGTKEEWKRVLRDDSAHIKFGNVIVI